jgi:putative transposase
VSGEYFHVYNRGNSKQEIFLNDKDKDRFVKLLYLSNSKKGVCFRDDIIDQKIDAWDFEREETLVSIGAWVLMPNHFHIYITSRKPGFRENEENKANITLFMHKLCVGYAKYFNKKNKRVGVLFEGPFKSVHIENDNQAKYLFSYIHLNPIKLIDSEWKKNGIKDTNCALEFLNDYKWSSYQDHRGFLRKENKILDLKNFPEYFSDIKDFDLEIFSWLRYK